MRIIIFCFLLLAALTFFGCSSGGAVNPVEPGLQPTAGSGPGDLISEIPDLLHTMTDSSQLSGSGVFAVYNVLLDYDSLSAELVPVRNTADLGDTFQADVTGFLNTLCADCLQIVGVGLTTQNYLEVTFRLHHPIPLPVDPSNPKGSDRLDLHLFDVRGIVLAEGNNSFPGIVSDIDGDGTAAEPVRCNASFIPNADGFTSFFDYYFDTNVFPTNANIHPYKMFFEDARQGNYLPDTSPENGWLTLTTPQGQNVFPQGDRTDDVTYVFAITPGTNLSLMMAFDASYGTTAKFSIPYPGLGSRMNPRYFLPEFHRKEAWKAFVDISNNELAHGAIGTTANVSVTIYDWQSGMEGTGDINYFTTPLTSISKTSDVELVQLSIPTLFSNVITEADNMIGSGTWTDPYVYTYTVSNSLNPVGGTHYGIAAIRDSLVSSGGGPSGATRDLTLINITDFTNYQVFPITVAANPPNVAPFAVFVTNPTQPIIQSGESVSFNASASIDTDGSIIAYEWDFEFDGTFEINATGVTPAPHVYNSPDPSRPHLFYAVLKVRDNGNPPLEGLFGAEVLVEANSPPVAVIDLSPNPPLTECTLVTLDGSASHDDGAIIAYEWDFHYSLSDPGFTIEATGPIVEKRFSPGTHDIMLRVWDDSSPALNGVTRLRLEIDNLSGNPGQVVFCDNFLLNETDSINSHSFSGGGQKSLVLSAVGAVTAVWVDEQDVGGGPAIMYSQSLDGGRTFDTARAANSQFISGGHIALKPTIAADLLGNLHLAYADSDGKFWYQQGGAFGVFGPAIEVGSGNRAYGAPAIAVDFLGNIHYFYTENESGGKVPLRLSVSTDGGNTFDSPITIAGDGRFPSAAAVDQGSVVIAYAGEDVASGDDSEIWVRYQRTGTLYYSPIRVSDSNAGEGMQTKPAVDVSENGSVHVVWMDSRLGDNDIGYDIFYSYSTTGLTYHPSMRVNKAAELPGEQTIQEYPTIGADAQGRAFIAWRDHLHRADDGGDIVFAFTKQMGQAPDVNMIINNDQSPDFYVVQGPPSILVSQQSAMMIMWGDERNATSDIGTPFSGEADIYYTFGQLF